jgi:short-subunit dehydrogenase
MEDPKRNKQTIWLVGASEGIGFSLCRRFLESGHHVIASSRNAQSHLGLTGLKQKYPNHLKLLNCDVTLKDQTTTCREAKNCFGDIDMWFYNAGAYQPMTMAQWDLEQFEWMNQVNYLGVVRLMTAIQAETVKISTWVWNISLAAEFGLPYGGGYSAPKAALMNLAESLQPELKSKGIDLKIINHGFVRTRLTEKNDFPMLGLMTPEQAAENIIKSLQSKRFLTRFPWNLKTFITLLSYLPNQISLKFTQLMLKKENPNE